MRDHIRYRQSNIIRTIPLSSGPMRAATRKSSSDAATATKMGNINCLYCTETTFGLGPQDQVATVDKKQTNHDSMF